MARRFFYVSLGILALALAYNLGASRTEAQSSGTTVVLGLAGDVVWDGSGQAWEIQSASQWDRVPEWDVPVPAAEVLFIQTRGSGFIGFFADLGTANGEVWGFNSNSPAPHWTYRGQVPGSPVPVEGSSFGAIKGSYK